MNTTPARRGDPSRARMARWIRRHCPARTRRADAPVRAVTRRRLLLPPFERTSLAHAFPILFPVRAAMMGFPREAWGPALEAVPAFAYGVRAYERAMLVSRARPVVVARKRGRLVAAVVRSRATHDAVGARLERRLRTAWQRTRPLDVHARRPKTMGTAPRPVVLSPAPDATRRSESHVGACDCLACAFAPAFSEAYALRMSVSHSLGSFT